MADNILIDNLEVLQRQNQYKEVFGTIPLENVLFQSNSSVSKNLDEVASHALNPRKTLFILYSYHQISLDIVSRWIESSALRNKYSDNTIFSALALACTSLPQSANLTEYFLLKANSLITLDEETLLAYYRIMNQNIHKFKAYIHPEQFYEVLESSTSTPVSKLLAVEILSLYLSASEEVRLSMLRTYSFKDAVFESSLDGVEGIDFTFLGLVEANRLSKFKKLPSIVANESPLKGSGSFVVKPENLTSLVVSICGEIIPKLHKTSQEPLLEDEDTGFVPTEAAVHVLRQMARKIQYNKPIMLYGEAGSGKTYLINELARRISYEHNLVKIHLGEQTDAKLLLGTYASGEKPGTFQWRSGVLTTAVQQGRWVIIEDIDAAPTEVLSVLLTLLEKKELSIPSRGEVIRAANGFQLICTVRTKSDLLPDMIGLRLWELLNVPTPTTMDLTTILNYRFPILGMKYVVKFIKCYNEIIKIYSTSSFISMNKGSHPRTISFRDLIKLCRRCTSLLVNEGFKTIEGVLLQSHVYDEIFAEAIDCFGSAITEGSALIPIVNAVGDILEIPQSRINLYMTKHIPIFNNSDEQLKIGRAVLKKTVADKALNNVRSNGNFARTNHSLRLMEQIGMCIQMVEPVLLVGETGTGKTTVVQQVAKLLNKKITVINVSQQTESGDLLGGYKPVNTKLIAVPIQEVFENLFIASFLKKRNEKFSQILTKCFNRNQWKNVVKLWKEAVKMAKSTLSVVDSDEPPSKKRKLSSEEKGILLNKWLGFEKKVKEFELQALNLDSSFIFNFVEGSLVKAVREGEWLLLDEINLASSDTLESIADLLSESLNQRSILLSERGDVEAIPAHPDFRIFGCMNPSTDVGKKDLPASIRSRFSEIYVHSPDSDINDLLSIVDKYIARYAVSDEWVGNDIAQLYLEAKNLSESNKIVDGANQRPHFSIRTLTRTLIYVCDIVSIYGLRRSLYEGFCMSYLTLLDAKSEDILHEVIVKYTLGRLKNAKSVMNQIPQRPQGTTKYVQFKHYWMLQGPDEIVPQPHYIITPSVEKNMLNLVRASTGRRFPVLIQGPTSAGKTSMIQYLASITGHKFVRINNHEHTDLQEYLGTYISDSTGKLVFKEGLLVEALRNGYWIVLDELNLAPTDVLEALNRLLDDNRELFIPETQEVVTPHPDFMLFATQNPPGLYGGRKFLSRAFRNRFLELHFDDIPQDELEIILRERCQIAPTYAKKIVEIYRQLSIQRQSTRLFEQKNSFATLRDLFRWALRDAVGYEQLAANGYMLLAERVRKPEEKEVVKSTIEKILKVKLDMDSYYDEIESNEIASITQNLELGIVWTRAMRRLAVLVFISMKYKEPLLLVGETGCGKTTVCQVIALFFQHKLITVNAHQNTETGDILGAQRPARNRFEAQGKLYNNLMVFFQNEGLSIDIENSTIDFLLSQFDKYKYESKDQNLVEKIAADRKNAFTLFEWSDGPLVQAMKNGEFFLLDEISLADDSVLERLNSVLEPERSLLLAEKGNDDAFIVGQDGFQFLATMNPGGDYGKKELSPALRNRFTEIWVPSMENFDDVRQIVASKLPNEQLIQPLVSFTEWYGKKYGSGNVTSGVVSLRDILSWVEFINSCTTLNPYAALYHGACMVFIDALGTNNTASLAESEERLLQEKFAAMNKLSDLCDFDLTQFFDNKKVSITIDESNMVCGEFKLARKPFTKINSLLFSLEAPTTAKNTMRVVRAMQVQKPILLEGSPGVGKTSLVTALAKATGNYLVRINLSEQTDLVDLFGSDAPTEGGKAGDFTWKDAPFLRAMQRGEWVLLDEMNLASQSVLEGLNACLDHRGSAYIPELDKTFTKHPDFVVFAAQNPQYQGGGRKGLPKSFVNRFLVVFVDTLKEEDLRLISHHLYPNIDNEVCSKLIKFVSKLEEEVSVKKSFGSNGGPWEFNLRDTLRWLEMYNTRGISSLVLPSDFLDTVVLQRFRNSDDKMKALSIFNDIFESDTKKKDSYFAIGKKYVQAGSGLISRKNVVNHSTQKSHYSLQCNFGALESIIRCVNLRLPVILTGPTNSGKTELIRYFADIVGAHLVEFAMNSDVDSMDILGGYEQVDVERSVIALSNRVSDYLSCLLLELITSENVNRGSITWILQFLARLSDQSGSSQDKCKYICDKLDQILIVYSNTKLQDFHAEAKLLVEKLSKEQSVRFEWFDGLLVQAVEQGHWLVLDNANLCSPSVLDRLNSLLEVNGSLMINECSDADGQPRQLKPHPNFRLFLTVDPKYGELSRAMRNRGIEIYLESLSIRMTSFDRKESVLSNLPCQRSGDRVFALIEDICEENPIHPSAAVNVLTFESLALVTPWVNLVLKLNFNCKSMAHTIVETYGSLDSVKLKSNYEIAFNDFISDCPFEDQFFANQNLNSLINVYLSHQVVNDETSSYFLALSGLYEIDNQIQRLENKAISQKVADLSYLELSAAVESGRNIKNPPKLNVYGFIVSLKNYIQREIRNFKCQKLIHLIIILQSLLQTSNLDVSKLRVFQSMIQEWCEEFEVSDIEVKEAIGLFDSGMQLTSGWSMGVIWERFRGTYPNSQTAWNQYQMLLEIAQKFDDVASKQFPEADEELSILVSSIGNCLEDVISGLISEEEFVEFYNRLSQGIDSLKSTSDDFVIKRENIFAGSLSIVNVSEVASLNSDFQNSALDHCLQKTRKSNFMPFPNIFGHLWTENGSYVSGLFTDRLISESNNTILNMKNGAAKNLDQSIYDLANFGKELIGKSPSILNNSKKVFKNYLCDWFTELSKIHSKEPLIVSLDNVHKVTPLTGFDGEFGKICEEFFSPALSLISESEEMNALGRAWILFATGCIQLFVPNSSYDPAIEEYVNYERFEKLNQFTEYVRCSWKIMREVISGDEKILIESTLPEGADLHEKPRVHRPVNSSIDNLIEEWNSMLESTLDVGPIASLLEKSDNFDYLRTFQMNTHQFLNRLKVSYSVYSDVNDILSGFIYGLKFGFELLALSQKENNTSWTIDAIDLSLPDKIKLEFDGLKSMAKSYDANSDIPEKLFTFVLELCKYHGETLKDVFEESLEVLYYRWSLRRMQAKEEEATQGSLYKYANPETDIEGDFKELFPDFEDKLSFDSQNLGKGDFTTAYLEISHTFTKSEPSSFGELVTQGSEIYNLMRRENTFSSELRDSSFLSLLHNLSLTFKSYHESTDINFYHDASLPELRKSIDIVKPLLLSTLKLLEQWPEHATLQNISRFCEEFLAFSASTPIGRLLQKIESIYTHIDEWEKFALTQVTLKSHFDQLTTLIVSWRKLELQSWKSLFVFEEKNLVKSLGKWWFYLFETIIISDEEITKVLAALNVFMSQSTYGEFQHRISVLHAFKSLCKGLEISQALQNFLQFYEQFVPVVQANLESLKKSLEKDINEVILLASWKDVNIDALKQSSRRSHSSLYKIVRKYRALLATSVQSIIELGMPYELTGAKPLGKAPHLNIVLSDVDQSLVKEIPSWSTRPSRLQNLRIIDQNMSIYLNRINEMETPSIVDFAEDLLGDMERLQKETPKELKKDNKKVIAALLVQKRKLLSDTLKELHRLGLKTSYRADINRSQESVNHVLSNISSFEETYLEDYDKYFFKVLDLLPRLRASVASPAEGVPPPDLDRGMAVGENLVFMLVNSRRPLVDFSTTVSFIEKLSNSLELSTASVFVRGSIYESLEFNMSSLTESAEKAADLLSFVIQTLESSNSFSQLKADTAIFYTVKSKCDQLLRSLQSHQKELLTEENLLLVQQYNENFVQLSVALADWNMKNPNFSFIGTSMAAWIESRGHLTVSSNTSRVDEIKTIESVEKSTRNLLTSIILAVQRMTELNANMSTEDDKWFTETQKFYSKLIKNTYHHKIASQFENVISDISEIEHNEHLIRLTHSLISFTLPLIRHYFNMIKDVLGKVRNNYYETSKATYMMSNALYVLATKGFCSPEPPTEQKEDDNLHDGTGLGDGEGASNAKDIEDDEDFTEDAQQPNKEEDSNDQEDEKEDEAVDIDGDMEGKLEDAPDEENDDQDEGEDGEDLDEEIDDIDDLDPNAIDDKMWDEEAKEDSKEKDSNEMPDDSKTNEDDMQARENEDDTNESKPSEDSKQEDGDEEEDENEEDLDVGEQEDEVKNEDNEQLDEHVPDTEVLDLPDDMNLDNEDDNNDEGEDDGDKFDDGLPDDNEEDSNAENEEEKNAMEEEMNAEGDEDDKQDEEMEDEEGNEEGEEDGEDENPDEDAEAAGEGETNEDNVEDEDLETEQIDKHDEEEGGGNDAEDENEDQGVDGMHDEANENADEEATLKQEFGEQGEGADTEVMEDNKDLGATGGASSEQQQDMEKTEENAKEEDARNEAKDSLKELGDLLKEFHRRRQEIKEASATEDNAEVEEKANIRPDEFQHLDGDSANFDTQALGAADQEQLQSIDEEKAIDDDAEQDVENNVREEPEPTEDMDVEKDDNEVDVKEENVDNDGDFDGRAQGIQSNHKEDLSEINDDLNMKTEQLELSSDEESNVEDLGDSVKIEDSEPPMLIETARELWKMSEIATQDLASGLCEQLRLILEPTLATKLRGDYKTGKRLNMKRIIPYIASDFRKDKIWLRRTKPSKRQYQIMIAIDDSKSMSESKSTELAFHSIALVSKALTQLESGGLSVVRFGEDVKVVHPFDRPFNMQESGARIFQWFDFQQTRTDIKKLCQNSLGIFEDAKATSGADLWQLQIILSDGVCEDHATVQRLVRKARESKIMLVFVVIDGINSNESILDMSQVSYETDSNTGASNLKVQKYLDTFPFEFYVIVRDINELPEMLSLILRQYFSEMASN